MNRLEFKTAHPFGLFTESEVEYLFKESIYILIKQEYLL